MRPRSARAATGALVVALAVWVGALYWATGHFPFVSIDDDVYVYENAHVLQGLTPAGMAWALRSFDAANWHPVTWWSHMLDVTLFGATAGWHHRVNVLLHVVNTLVLFLLLRRITGARWRSALVAALFGIHPQHVESVAWVAERKDVLSTLFGLITIAAYARWVRRPDVPAYACVIACYAIGLSCKPMLVTLPFVLLLLDRWPLERVAPGRPLVRAWVPLVAEKLPLMALATACCVVVYLAQSRGGAVTQLAGASPLLRFENAIVAVATYLAKTVWPTSLAVFYPHPASLRETIPAGVFAAAAGLLAAISLGAAAGRRRHPWLAVGWLWFLGTLVPVSGLIQVGAQSRADRYTYLPLVGIFIMLAWGAAALVERWRWSRLPIVAVAIAALVALSAATWRQVGYWNGDFALFGRALQVSDRNWLAWNDLGVAYEQAGDPEQALANYERAVQIEPQYASAWFNLGALNERLGRRAQAIAAYREAVAADSRYARAWNNLGTAYADHGDLPRAAECFRTAVRVEPRHASAWFNLGMASLMLGRAAETADCLERLRALDPAQARTLESARDSLPGSALAAPRIAASDSANRSPAR